MEIIRRSNPTTTPIIDDGDDSIPDWLLFEILLRLPIKSVFKSRVVSKRWLSVASAPYFVRAYASRASSSSSRPPWIVLSQSVLVYDKIVPKFVHNPSKNSYFIPRELYLRPQPHEPDNKEFFSIIGLSDGLVLYISSNTEKAHLDRFNFYVCNPVTGHRTVPIPVPDGVRIGWGFLTRVDQEFTLKSYRIVQAMQKPKDPSAIIFSVYYSEIGDWRRFTVKWPGPSLLDLQKSAAVLNGILYWADRGDYVIVYDPKAKPGHQVRFIRDPHDKEKPQSYKYSCFACRGELRYFGGHSSCYSGMPESNIWKLEDYNSGEWRLVHKIEDRHLSRVLGMHNRLEIVCFDPFDSDVLCLTISLTRSAFSYDLKSGTLDDYREMIVEYEGTFTNSLRMSFPYTVVLVVPPWPTLVSEKQLEQHKG